MSSDPFHFLRKTTIVGDKRILSIVREKNFAILGPSGPRYFTQTMHNPPEIATN